ncbi:MAG: PIN domain-containing protein, partial [Actinophytocola sp.]|nr:PIN domain-containing protein [Actinophytocola sp.]
NVVSELMRPDSAAGVVAWVDQFPADQVFITAVTAAELMYGVAWLPNGRRKQTLVAKVRDLIGVDFEDQVLPFTAAAAAQYAEIVASRERLGRPISMADAQIAAICRQHDLHLGTRNAKDFADVGIRVLNPWA